MYFHWMRDQTKLSSILTIAAHSEECALRGQKYQTCLILSSRPGAANFPPQFPRTREETAEQTALRGSFLSSFLKCAAGFKSLPTSRILGHFSSWFCTEQIYGGFSVGKGYFGHDLTCISNDLGPFV